jgi:hypothetical protein
MTQTHNHQPATPAPYLPPPPAPTPSQVERPRRGRLLPIVTLIVAVGAAVVAGIALARQPSPPSSQTASPAPTVAPASAAEIAAARREACEAWTAASTAMVSARQPFINSPPNWDDPITVNALAQAQAGMLAQVEYLRQHVPPATPAEVAVPVHEFITANIDLIALDGQQQSAGVANAAAERSIAAAARIRTACGS